MSLLNNFSTEKFKLIVKESKHISEVGKKLGYKNINSSVSNKILLRIKKENINIAHFQKDRKTSIIWNIDKIELSNIINDSYSYSEVLSKLGYSNFSGQVFRNMKIRILNEKIDISHFGTKQKLIRSKKILTNEQIFIKNSPYTRSNVKKRILKDNLIEYKCEKCGNKGEWLGEEIALELEHKNGVNNDNRLENLCFLCPNCHATTPTYAGRNVKRKNSDKVNQYKYRCKTCGSELKNQFKTGLCKDCFRKIEQVNRRKTNRPSYEQLLEDKKTMSMLAIGKKYKVSDNTIRKWMKQYEKQKSVVNIVK